MKKKIFAFLTALCMTAAMLPAVFADGEEEPIECTCTTQCTEESKNETCPVCGVEGADLSQCTGIPPMTAGDGEDEEEPIECTCTTQCTEESKNETCPVCGSEDADLSQCTGTPPMTVDAQEQCSCVTLCTEGNTNSDCPVCSAVNADLSACKGEPVVPVLFGAPRAGGIPIDKTYFPDPIFRDYVEQFDTDGDNNLSETELNSVTTITVNNQGITSLKGIEHFTNLQTLDCRSNQLTSLDVSQNKALTTLNCSVNPLNSLDVSQNIELKSLYCASNNLISLDVSQNKELTDLNCINNALTKLDVSQNEKLTQLQQQFSDFVMRTEKTKTTISKSLEKLETLKKALMQEYFG